jgi:hypothetical protein
VSSKSIVFFILLCSYRNFDFASHGFDRFPSRIRSKSDTNAFFRVSFFNISLSNSTFARYEKLTQKFARYEKLTQKAHDLCIDTFNEKNQVMMRMTEE